MIYNTYVPIFLQAGSPQFDSVMPSNLHGFGLTAVQTGFVMSLDNIAALLLQPLTGALSDRTHTRFGRRLPFILIGMPMGALGIAVIPLALSSGLLSMFMLCLLAMVIAMACWRAPLFALMADLTPSPDRSRANGVMNLMAGLGGVLAFVAGSLLYALYRPFPFWMAALIMLIACGLILWGVREPISSVLAGSHSTTGLFRASDGWYSTLQPDRRRSLLLLTLAVFFYMLGFHPLEAFFSSYGVSVLKLSEANSGLVFSAAYITFILFAVPAGMLAAKTGRKRAVLGGLLLFVLALLIAFLTPVTAVIAVLMGVGGLAWALIDINAFPMFLDIAPGPESTEMGTAAGVYFVAATLAAVLGPILNGWLIDLSGRNYSMIFLIGPAFLVLSFIIMLSVKHGEAHQ